tara:strand:+ start:1082 stop:2044 length:963 start_codon:yes stop_codon:yes gene_type:complete
MSNSLLVPKTMNEAIKYAKLLATSTMVPKQFQGKPEDIMVAIQWGAEVGLPAMSALQGIAVINGRPTIYGDAALSLAVGHPQYAGHKEWIDGETAHCLIRRKVNDEMVETERTFSVGEAKRAGLFGKPGPWKQYPNRMLQMRARGFAIRDAFPDAMKGVSIDDDRKPDEMVDVTPENPLDAIQAPGPEKEAPAEAAPEEMVVPDEPAVQTEEEAAPAEPEQPTVDPDAKGWELILTDGEVQEFYTAEEWTEALIGKLSETSTFEGSSFEHRRHLVSVIKKDNDDTIDRLKEEQPDLAEGLGKGYIKLIKSLSAKAKEAGE